MKATGIVRKIDSLGRIVLPVEIRETLGIEEKDPLEIFVDGENIVFKKYSPTCIFCDATEHLTLFKDKRICPKCMEELTKQ
ncbi:MAG: AbrB/MazE/SpoVT family DNA-binding domain-containing protein [Clostridia bacterium]|jgi:transcriptional pleiotropic regulator of transition state genes|nr:AbrB/MazE/SpoVT family DNA-binding domain-containing protein [Clostridia bacterium]MBR3715980.1 AbrB/MazE/SpoVT family DNA-binding domain-containing protein [Clostridia bacterium]